MAFLSKVGNILRQGANKRIGLDLQPSGLSICQAVRWMSSMQSSKLFIGGSLRMLCYSCYFFPLKNVYTPISLSLSCACMYVWQEFHTALMIKVSGKPFLNMGK